MSTSKVLVLCAYYRCGSTALCEHYSKKYNIPNYDEMFFRDADPDKVIDSLSKNNGYVLKIISEQWKNNMEELHRKYIKDVFSEQGTKVILLYRNNIAESLLSMVHCNHTSTWHNKENNIQDNEINILVNKAVDTYNNEYIDSISGMNNILKYITPSIVFEYQEIFNLSQQGFKKANSNKNYNLALEKLTDELKKQLTYESKYFSIT